MENETGRCLDAKERELPGLVRELPVAVLVAAGRGLGVLFCSFGLAFCLTPAVNGGQPFFTAPIMGFAAIGSAVLGSCVFGIRRHWRRSLLLATVAMAVTVMLATMQC